MKQFETEHYLFHFAEASKAEQDIEKIAAHQEACYRYICKVLEVTPTFKIEYFLCDSPEEVGRLYGDDDPCNGFADLPDKIYAVYNEKVQCIGFHEDAHVISNAASHQRCPALLEGLAMYFDRKWWGIDNLDWTGYYLKTGRYLAVDQLLDRETFFGADCSITYPIMGAFTDYLIATYGSAAYMALYSKEDAPAGMEEVYQLSPAALNREFVAYVRLFGVDGAVEKRMEELLRE